MQQTLVSTDLDLLLDRFKKIAQGEEVSRPTKKFSVYAISNFRGGIGKSTLAFNLGYELSREHNTLLLDLCPQSNFTRSLLDDTPIDTPTIYNALISKIMPGLPNPKIDDLLISVPPYCVSYKMGKNVFLIPGAKELFLFPSTLYSSLSQTHTLADDQKQASMQSSLRSIESLIESIREKQPFGKVLMDTSPFFGGATHLAWIAAEALIIPTRVDRHSIEALKLTLSMLRQRNMDFMKFNEMAGITRKPVVHAIVMTHCGWSRQKEMTPDKSTQAYLGEVIKVAYDFKELLSSENPIECIHVLDDFHTAGRISGAKRIPLALLETNQEHYVQGQKLEVNESIVRYQRELKSLASIL